MRLFQLLENSKYDWDVTTISREIIRLLKKNIRTIRDREYILLLNYPVPSIWEDMNYATMTLPNHLPKITVLAKKQQPYGVHGSFDGASRELKLYINMPTARSQFPSVLSELLPRIKETLYHELVHSGQDVEDLKKAYKIGKYSEEAFEKYFLQPTEIEAFVGGLRKQARTRKITFEQQLDNYLAQLKLRAEEHNIDSSKLIPKIRNVWLAYYKERYKK